MLSAIRWGQPLTKRQRWLVAKVLIGMFYAAAGYLIVLNVVLAVSREFQRTG